jgi:hypothetical protein
VLAFVARAVGATDQAALARPPNIVIAGDDHTRPSTCSRSSFLAAGRV